MLARQPGTKEARFAHLLCGEAGMFAPAQSSDAAVLSVGESPERIERCEAEIETLKREIAALRQQLEELQKLLR
jgi:hypothetical protein